MSLKNRFVSIVLPVQEAGPVSARLASLHGMLSGLCANFEIVVIDDGCGEPLERVLAGPLRSLSGLRVLTLSRRFGGEAAIRAGLQSAIGDVVVVMEIGLDPVSRVPDMLELCMRGHGVVVGVPESGFDEYPLRKICSAVFHGMNRRLTGMEMYPGSSWFRALSRSALNALAVSQYDTLPFRHATVSLGFNPGVLKYRRDPVSGEVPRPSFLKDVQQAVDVLFLESGAPGLVMAVAGVLGMLLSLLMGLPLWFLVFVMLSVLSQYVHRNLQRLQPRPAYVVMHEVSSAVEIRDAGRRNVVHESG
jgi:dolichol-phosphate mannosyltransferase